MIYLKVRGTDKYEIYRCSNDIRSHWGSPYIVDGRIYHDSKQPLMIGLGKLASELERPLRQYMSLIIGSTCCS